MLTAKQTISLIVAAICLLVVLTPAQAAPTAALETSTNTFLFLPAVFKAPPVCGGFFDDFSNQTSGWPYGEDADLRLEYSGGEYRILGKTPGYYYYVKAPTCKSQNYIVEVDARWAGNSGYGNGIAFGMTDDLEQHYLFIVNSDRQEYSVFVKDYYYNEIRNIIGPTYHPSIKKGTASNHLKVVRSGTAFTVEINGVLIASLGSWNDSSILGETYVGLVNMTYSDLSNADARFDNFQVTRLSNSASLQSTGVQEASPIGEPREMGALPVPEDLLQPEK